MKHRNSATMDRIIPFVNDFYRDNRRSPSLRQISAGTGIPHMTVKRMLNTLAENGLIDYDGRTIVTEQENKHSDEMTPVGIVGSIPCGALSLEEEAVEEIVSLPVSIFGKGELYILHASGDSMTGAGIEDGDLVLIRKQEEARHGDIVAAFIEGEGNTLKRCRQQDGRILLHPENPKYKDIPLENGRIQGVAIYVIKKL